MEKWFNAKSPVRFRGEAPGSGFSDSTPRILEAALGLPVKAVLGCKGTSEAKLAADSGEVDGICLSWVAGKTPWGEALQTGDVIPILPILQTIARPIPEIPNVPLAINYAKTDEARQFIDAGLHKPLCLPGTVQNIHVLLRYRDFLKRVTATKIYQYKANLVKGLISIPSRFRSLIFG